MQVERERLVHGKILLQADVEPQVDTLRVARGEPDDPAFHERAEKLPRAAEMRLLFLGRAVRTADEALHRAAAVLVRAAEHVEQRAVRHLELRQEPFRRRGDEAREGRLVPRHVTFFRRLAAHEFLAALLFEHADFR